MDFSAFFVVIETVFVLLAAGFVLRKMGIVDGVATNRLSKLIINIAQPSLIISSLISAEYSRENLFSGFRVFFIGMAIHAFMSVFAFVVCGKMKNFDERKISEFALVFANCGFLGFPVLESRFGAKGLFLGAFYIISFHLFLWTWGVAILARKRKDIKLTWKKVLLNFGTVPCTIGLILYLLNLNLPQFVYQSVSYLGSLCTPVAMIVTGSLIATKPLKEFFTSLKLYYVSLQKLIVLPILICVLMSLMRFDAETVLFCTALAAIPSASTTSRATRSASARS